MFGRHATPRGLELPEASPERLEVLFRDWPPVERQGARARLDELFRGAGTDGSVGVCITRLRRCVVVELAASGLSVRVPVPAGF